MSGYDTSSPLKINSHAAAAVDRVLVAIDKPILCLYSDGGPDHRRALDLDCLIAARKAPNNSFRNPVERIMSLLNVELQAVGVMRGTKSDEFEAVLKKVNSMEEIRKVAREKEGFKEEFLSSMSPPIELIKI